MTVRANLTKPTDSALFPPEKRFESGGFFVGDLCIAVSYGTISYVNALAHTLASMDR